MVRPDGLGDAGKAVPREVHGEPGVDLPEHRGPGVDLGKQRLERVSTRGES